MIAAVRATCTERHPDDCCNGADPECAEHVAVVKEVIRIALDAAKGREAGLEWNRAIEAAADKVKEGQLSRPAYSSKAENIAVQLALDVIEHEIRALRTPAAGKGATPCGYTALEDCQQSNNGPECLEEGYCIRGPGPTTPAPDTVQVPAEPQEHVLFGIIDAFDQHHPNARADAEAAYATVREACSPPVLRGTCDGEAPSLEATKGQVAALLHAPR